VRQLPFSTDVDPARQRDSAETSLLADVLSESSPGETLDETAEPGALIERGAPQRSAARQSSGRTRRRGGVVPSAEYL